MEALNFLRFWKPSYGAHKENQNPPCNGNSGGTEVPKSLVASSDHELDEGEDSFIDLELPLHEFDEKGNVQSSCREGNGVQGKKRLDSEEERAAQEPARNVCDKELDLPQQKRSLSPNDHFSKRKIIPIETSTKPQSPIALLKSAPKFRVFTLKKSKSMANANTYRTEKTELIGISMETPKRDKQGSSKHLKVKFNIEESPDFRTFTRENSLRRTKGKTEDSLAEDSSKSLSKDLMQKYLNMIRPLYFKVSKRSSQSDRTKISSDLSMSSPAASPATVYSLKEKQGNLSTGVKGVCKHLGKSRSASASASPISRRDDSLILQHDGIQSAIMHCKRSFNSSRAESSWLSGCTSDSSQEKLSNASSTDSSLLSRVTSNSSCEKLMDSARISSEGRNVLST